jgi:hypothetical protein
MNTSKVVWIKKLIDSRYLLYQDGKQVGFLVNSAFKMYFTAELNNERIFLHPKGFMSSNFNIFSSDKEKIGEVKLDLWKLRAKISFNDSGSYEFAFTNIFHLDWIVAGESNSVNYTSSITNGSFEFQNFEDKKLALTGLAIQSYLAQSGYSIFTVFFLVAVLLAIL